MNVISDTAVVEVLNEYRRRMDAENVLRGQLPRQEWLRRRDEFLLEVGEAVAAFMNILVREAKAKTIRIIRQWPRRIASMFGGSRELSLCCCRRGTGLK